MARLSWIYLCLWVATEAADEALCTERGEDQQSLLQTTVKGSEAGRRFQSEGDEASTAQMTEKSMRSLADTAEDVQAARVSTKAAVGYESQAAELLRLAYKEVKQAEDIQEARVYEEANVTQILHDAVQQLQSSPLGDTSLLQALRRAEIAQASMINDANLEDQALAGLRSAMATAVQAATSAKLVDETQTAQTLDDALLKVQESAQATKDSSQKLGASEERLKQMQNKLVLAEQKQATERAHAYIAETQKARQDSLKAAEKERSAAAADREKAETARREASAMYQAASSTQEALEKQASQTAQSLLRVSAEASQAAQFLQGALRTSNNAVFDVK